MSDYIDALLPSQNVACETSVKAHRNNTKLSFSESNEIVANQLDLVYKRLIKIREARECSNTVLFKDSSTGRLNTARCSSRCPSFVRRPWSSVSQKRSFVSCLYEPLPAPPTTSEQIAYEYYTQSLSTPQSYLTGTFKKGFELHCQRKSNEVKIESPTCTHSKHHGNSPECNVSLTKQHTVKYSQEAIELGSSRKRKLLSFTSACSNEFKEYVEDFTVQRNSEQVREDSDLQDETHLQDEVHFRNNASSIKDNIPSCLDSQDCLNNQTGSTQQPQQKLQILTGENSLSTMETALLPGQSAYQQRSMKGVSFDRSKRNWEASWLDARTGRRIKKCFSEGRWGASARDMAIMARKEAEHSGAISTRQQVSTGTLRGQDVLVQPGHSRHIQTSGHSRIIANAGLPPTYFHCNTVKPEHTHVEWSSKENYLGVLEPEASSEDGYYVTNSVGDCEPVSSQKYSEEPTIPFKKHLTEISSSETKKMLGCLASSQCEYKQPINSSVLPQLIKHLLLQPYDISASLQAKACTPSGYRSVYTDQPLQDVKIDGVSPQDALQFVQDFLRKAQENDISCLDTKNNLSYAAYSQDPQVHSTVTDNTNLSSGSAQKNFSEIYGKLNDIQERHCDAHVGQTELHNNRSDSIVIVSDTVVDTSEPMSETCDGSNICGDISNIQCEAQRNSQEDRGSIQAYCTTRERRNFILISKLMNSNEQPLSSSKDNKVNIPSHNLIQSLCTK